MKQLNLLLVFMFLLVAGIPAAFAQNRTITGKITDASGQPLVGATVAAKGSNISTQTNSEGIFSITVPAGVQKLAITSVGFAPQEVSIGGKTNISLALHASASELSEVIVTALGVERNKKSLQFSATTVSGDNFTQAREI